MGNFLTNISRSFKGHKNVVIIIMVALVVELISATQYYYAHNLLEKEMDSRAEGELSIKAVLIKGILNMAENTMKEHIWDFKRNISRPDSMFAATERTIENSPQVKGFCLAFVPYYYPEKGQLFEPYIYKEGNNKILKQLGGENKHDYTQHPAFQRMVKEKIPFWSDPYDYVTSNSVSSLITFSYPLLDNKNNLVAVCGLDLSLEQIGDTLNYRHIYPSSFNLLLTESGKIISRPSSHHVKYGDIEQVVRLINDSTVKRETSKSGRTKYIEFESEKDKDNGVIYFANMKGKPKWQVVVVSYEKEIYGKLYWMRINLLFLLLLAFGFLWYIIQKYAKNEKKLHQANIKQELISSELRIAQAIQKNMLPKKYPPFPERDDINIYGSLVPAKEVGGDIFDFFLRDEKLFFCIGDVSGKGVPSAIVMAEIHSKFRMASAHENDPAHIMQTLNTSSCEGNDTNIFVTFFIGVLDLPSGRLRYCNAGHDFPFIVSQSAEQVVSPLPVKPNLPIGLFDDFHYEKQEIYLEYDTTLFLYTDGLTEAKNKVHKQFDTDRIAETLNNNANALPEEIIQKMNEQVHLFVEDAEQSDDLTMLAIKYTRKAYDYSLKESITLKNDIKQVKDLNSFVKSITDKLNMETSQAKNIKLAVEEAVVNVMDYAYPIGTEGDITLQALYNGRKLKFIISDNGIAFDPTKSSVADTSLSVEDRPVGGLGLLLVREMMDSINYERVNGKNTLTLITVYPKKEK